MNILLSDTSCRERFLPFTHTRNVADIRIGIFTIREKWKLLLDALIVDDKYLQPPVNIDANIIPTPKNAELILENAKNNIENSENDLIKILEYSWDIFRLNAYAIVEDYHLISKNRQSHSIDNTNSVDNLGNLFVEENVNAKHVIFNTDDGPIYIGKNVKIMEGSIIRGPLAICNNAVVKMGAKIYSGTTIGPNCIVGGEIKNSVFFGNSNKAHDGYLGDSVIGEWCNFGAGSSNSNVKNTGGIVKYNISGDEFLSSKSNKGGLLMGDYSRCAINTSFTTASLVGVSCNIFGDVSSEKYFKNFTWGKEKYKLEEAILHIDNWKKMKGENITENEIENLKKLYHQS